MNVQCFLISVVMDCVRTYRRLDINVSVIRDSSIRVYLKLRVLVSILTMYTESNNQQKNLPF